jgi:hypothetical protein
MTTVLASRTPPWVNRGPPVRAAAFELWRSLRGAHGPLLLTTGTACAELVDKQKL